ncbi:hypothetical protein MUK72_15180 (plasmid) [Halococcus dombrowskii]|uniref:Uncharacterized protein n=1 Tax=Halococcus dombrowskii TaxID=179637 RepID=A0AAX3AR98_HALDO|nr:hypothetical protein [Halococcus dombrowskii]UOO96862.1 hypothetical protein MUK72_15180 [Halococcus dombrowskii]
MDGDSSVESSNSADTRNGTPRPSVILLAVGDTLRKIVRFDQIAIAIDAKRSHPFVKRCEKKPGTEWVG